MGFIAWNLSIVTWKFKRIDLVKVNYATKVVVNEFYDCFSYFIIQAIKCKNCYNKDEMGFIESVGSNGLVVGPLEVKIIVQTLFGLCTWSFFIEYILAKGVVLLLLTIF